MPYRLNPFTGKLDEVGSGSISQQVINNYIDSSSTVQNIIDGSGWQLPGPFVNQSAAATAGVAIGQAYYANGGTVRVRLA